MGTGAFGFVCDGFALTGGFAAAAGAGPGGLSMSGAFGVLAGLLTRIRELIWVAIGIGLIKVGKGKLPVLEEIKADNDS